MTSYTSFLPDHRVWSGHLLVLALLVTTACAPVREDVNDAGLPGQQLQTALFTVVQNGSWSEYDQASLVLVDADVTCSDLSWSGSLNWWGLPDGVSWLNLSLLKGREVEDWTVSFESYAQWSQDSTWDYENAAYFSGQMGVGGEETLPSPVGREVTSNIGTEEDQLEDQLTLTSVADSAVRGYLESVEGDYAAYAVHCGTVTSGKDGDDDDVPIGRDD